MRKIIKLDTTNEKILYALCDDGTMWYLLDGVGSMWAQWQQLPAIPDNSPISNDAIRNIALAEGFELKEQKNGEKDLHDYVYRFARRIRNM